MKKKVWLFILIGIVVFLQLGLIARALVINSAEQRYFDVYRDQAEEYIKASPEMLDKYGADFAVRFDNSVTYSPGEKKDFFEDVADAFWPRLSHSLEEFSCGMDMIKFRVTVSGDAYEITFEKDGQGKFAVSSLTEAED